jgi:maltodextrin utilization protein YvdJ
LFEKLFNYSKNSEEYIKRIEALLDTIEESKNQAITDKFFEKLTSFKIHKEELLSFLIDRLDEKDNEVGFKSLSQAQFNTLQ